MQSYIAKSHLWIRSVPCPKWLYFSLLRSSCQQINPPTCRRCFLSFSARVCSIQTLVIFFPTENQRLDWWKLVQLVMHQQQSRRATCRWISNLNPGHRWSYFACFWKPCTTSPRNSISTMQPGVFSSGNDQWSVPRPHPAYTADKQEIDTYISLTGPELINSSQTTCPCHSHRRWAKRCTYVATDFAVPHHVERKKGGELPMCCNSQIDINGTGAWQWLASARLGPFSIGGEHRWTWPGRYCSRQRVRSVELC